MCTKKLYMNVHFGTIKAKKKKERKKRETIPNIKFKKTKLLNEKIKLPKTQRILFLIKLIKEIMKVNNAWLRYSGIKTEGKKAKE